MLQVSIIFAEVFVCISMDFALKTAGLIPYLPVEPSRRNNILRPEGIISFGGVST